MFISLNLSTNLNAEGFRNELLPLKIFWIVEDNLKELQPVKIRFYLLKDTSVMIYEEELNCVYRLTLDVEIVQKLNKAMNEVYSRFLRNQVDSNRVIVKEYLAPLPCNENIYKLNNMKVYNLFVKTICMMCLLPLTSYPQQKFVSQSNVPDSVYFKKLPDYPDEYSAETVTARLIEGLAFRYYWASDGLRPNDLSYRPGPNTRTTEETIDHIMGLSKTINNAIIGKENLQTGEETSNMDFAIKRNITLENLRNASESLRLKKVLLKDLKIVFVNKEGKKTEYPFWNNINGPLSDALWHVGQIVSFRRSSGNPFNSKVRLLTGLVTN